MRFLVFRPDRAIHFSVVGSKIYDPDGKEFIANGTGIVGWNSCWGGDPVADFDNVVNCWKFNTVRVYMQNTCRCPAYFEYTAPSTQTAPSACTMLPVKISVLPAPVFAPES
jgi:hypothetical protein